MELVTGFKGEPHISAENWADLNRGLAGDGSYVLPVGEKFRAELVTNNLLKIYDGCGIFQGRQVVIPAGQSDEITIENGSQGEKRIDIVGVRYVKDESSKIETTESVYVKGTPAESDPVAPNLEEGNIRAGDLVANWALYQVELDGLNVVSVTPLFETLRSGAEVAEELEALNSKLPVVLYNNDDTPAKGAITLSESSANFTRLKIFYKNTNGFYSSVDVYEPNGKTVTLLNFAYGDVDNTDPMILKFRVIDISDNKIDTGKSTGGTYVTGEQRLSADRHYTKGDFIAITTVLGYR